jgi:hypothetical protein
MEYSQDNISESHLILLLQLIYSGADVDALLKRGLQYSQIAKLLDEAIEKQFVEESDTDIVITPIGLEKIKTGAKDNTVRKTGGWISPLDEYRVEKIDLNDIFLPCLGSVHFDIAKSLALRGQPRE